MSTRPLRILILSNFYAYVANANVIRDYLYSFKEYSRNDCYYIINCSRLTARTDFSPFDVIVLFWDIYIIGSSLKPEVTQRIRESSALKVLFLQDEYREVRRFNQAMAELGINVMCTCVAEKDHETFYPSELIPTLQATYSVLTGYVPAYLEGAPPDYSRPRRLDIGYRSRDVPYWLGDLGREKRIIAEKFSQISQEHGLKSDISVRESDRLYGKHWIRFLKSARLTLGTGSGASVIDYSGEIRKNCEAYLQQNPQAPYEDLRERFFADVDGKVVIDTVSPRIFETAACGNTLVLHEAPYAGILVPDQHYIPVKKDYSNIDDVLLKIRDLDYCRNLSVNAYTDLIASRKYNYQSFVRWFDDMLRDHVGQLPARPDIILTRFGTRQTIVTDDEPVHVLTIGHTAFRTVSVSARQRIDHIRHLMHLNIAWLAWRELPRHTAIVVLSRWPRIYRLARTVWRSAVASWLRGNKLQSDDR